MLRTFLLLAAAGALCCACSRADRPVAVRAKVPPAATPVQPASKERGPLPPELARFKTAIDRSELKYIAVIATREQGTAPLRSKLRGAPYLPKGQAWPLGEDGKPLALLAQINFADMPPLAGFPGSGIVQFFISGEESTQQIYGMAYDDGSPWNAERYFEAMSRQRYFRTIYHADVAADAGTASTPPRTGTMLPVSDEAALSFEARTEAVSVADKRFEQFLGKDAGKFFEQFGDRENAVATAYMAFAGNDPVAKIGGYTNVVQEDPRPPGAEKDWVVLLEIRSAFGTDGVEILWGDAGVGVFFIRREDLRRRDFSKVAYYWDNH